MAITYTSIENSSYLDFSGYRITDATTVPAAFGFPEGQRIPSGETFYTNVAIVLERANDPTDLLAGNWASRQEALKDLNESSSLWSTYGASQTEFDAALGVLKDDLGLTILNASNSNYVTSAESRTIWVQLSTPAEFEKLFNTPQMEATNGDLRGYWNGGLSLPEQLKAVGLWFDTSIIPPGSNLAPGASVTLPQGPQSIGNSGTPSEATNLVPQDMAAQYDFPLDGAAVQTKKVGLIEPGIGSALPGDQMGTTFQEKLTKYLADIGQSGDGVVTVQGANGQVYDNSAGERSLDVSIVAGVNPNSDIALFNGSGQTSNGAQATTYTAIQSATFPGEGVERVVAWSDSFGDLQSMSPHSPFYRAYWELYVDTVLANQTAVTALGDGGSSEEIGNGLTNLQYNCTQPSTLR